MKLKNKNILVTGSSSGIGQAIAVALAQKGATILITYRNNKEGAQKTLKEVDKYSRGYIYQADLTKNTDAVKLFATIKKDLNDIDILVNNAGDAQPGDIFDNEKWLSQYENIFMSAVYATQNFLKLKANTPKKIINITSVYGGLTTGNPEYLQYSVAKAALNSLTMNLAKSLGKEVLVNAIAPGYTWTPPWEGISKQEKERYSKSTKIGRFVQSEEIAHVAVMLAENNAITGQIITVDGGLSLRDLNTHQ